MITFEHPLQWLPQQPRTKRQERARFGNHSPSRAGDYLIGELERLGSKKCVISSNMQTKLSGGFYANQSVEDTGVVVYFELKKEGKAMACDRWDRVEHNLWALYLSVCAIRGLERWGGSEFLDGLFSGFKALPGPGDVMTTEVDYFQGVQDKEHLKERYKKLAKELHPDLGGDEEQFSIMSRQHKQREGGFE